MIFDERLRPFEIILLYLIVAGLFVIGAFLLAIALEHASEDW